MPGRIAPSLISCLLALTVFSSARAEMMQFTPDRDNTLYEHPEFDLSNGLGDYIFMGQIGTNANPPSMLRRALVRFDLSVITPDAVIDSVQVQFTIVQVPPQEVAVGGIATLHRLLADWGEGDSNAPGVEGQGTDAQPMDATWDYRFYDMVSPVTWDTPGGDFLAQESAGVGYGTDPETLVFISTRDLVRDVQNWVRNPDENFGWILLGSEGQDHTARSMNSKDEDVGSPPLLTVEYHIEGPTDNLELELVTSDLTNPVVITNAGDGSNRLFIVEQEGVIRIYDLENDTLLATPFLDISDQVESDGSEEGLLGLAFHPDYETNGQFYVNYTYPPPLGDDFTRIAMFEVSAGNPDVADPNSEVSILEFEQDFDNHNGGDMHFDPNGYLVIATGDGGSGDDPNNRGQSLDTLLGKMLRIDVDSTRSPDGDTTGLCGLVQNYSIPPDNPYAGADEGCDEILHYGLRNPWRFSFDARTGEMFIGDVGQGLWEEISYAPVGATNINYGWRICEGAHIRGEEEVLCDFGTLPIIEYSSGAGSGNCSVTGGYVYRGGNKSLQGRYVYGDYCSARIWIATREGDNWVSEEWMESPSLGFIPTFGQDEQCELYVADFTGGNIYRFSSSEIIDSDGFEELRCQ